jgi:hypothetical protein
VSSDDVANNWRSPDVDVVCDDMVPHGRDGRLPQIAFELPLSCLDRAGRVRDSRLDLLRYSNAGVFTCWCDVRGSRVFCLWPSSLRSRLPVPRRWRDRDPRRRLGRRLSGCFRIRWCRSPTGRRRGRGPVSWPVGSPERWAWARWTGYGCGTCTSTRGPRWPPTPP